MLEIEAEADSARRTLPDLPGWITSLEWSEPPAFEPERILGLLPRLVSARTGLIKSLAPVKPAPTEPKLFSFFAALADPLQIPALAHSWYGTGIGLTPEEALGATIGEALERYSLFTNRLRPAATVKATYPEVAEWAIAPFQFARCSDSEYARCPDWNLKLTPYDPATRYNWVWGYSLTRRQPVLVPATQVYWTHPFEPAQCFVLPGSSGTSLGQSLLQASLQGLYEVVERDAFMIAWLNRLAMPRLDLAALAAGSKPVAAVVQAAEGAFVELHLNNLTTDLGIPVILAICYNRGQRQPGLVVGASCNLDPQKAVSKALLEALHCRIFFSGAFRRSAGLTGPLKPEQVTTRDEHVALYTQPEMVSALDFFRQAPQLQTWEHLPDHLPAGENRSRLEFCLARLLEAGMEAVVVDITVPEVRDMGYWVVRVLVPQAQPLNFGPVRNLNSSRLYHVPVKLGYRSQPALEEALNPWPHPFP
jgi:ribosomal protein S12 methylthiotransferase accessory factor